MIGGSLENILSTFLRNQRMAQSSWLVGGEGKAHAWASWFFSQSFVHICETAALTPKSAGKIVSGSKSSKNLCGICVWDRAEQREMHGHTDTTAQKATEALVRRVGGGSRKDRELSTGLRTAVIHPDNQPLRWIWSHLNAWECRAERMSHVTRALQLWSGRAPIQTTGSISVSTSPHAGDAGCVWVGVLVCLHGCYGWNCFPLQICKLKL